MKITFLGTGTSQGVPIIGCKCDVCCSTDVRDNRLRTSAMIEVAGKHIQIDAGPDFRAQALRNKTPKIDAILLTHEHKDHTAGLDDVRPFNFMTNSDMDIFCEHRVAEALKREFSYVFDEQKYPGIPQFAIHEFVNSPFDCCGIEVVPIRVTHLAMPIFGFRIGKLAYITDASSIADEELQKLIGCDVLVVNALRHEIHYSHFNLAQALQVVERVKPKKAYLTHIGHRMGLHAVVSDELPENVFLAYDGLEVEISD